MKICIITWPISGHSKAPWDFLSDLITIMKPIASRIFLICPSTQFLSITDSAKIQIYNVNTSVRLRIARYLCYQVKVSRALMHLPQKPDIVWLHGGSTLLLPNIVAHTIGAKVCIYPQGPDYKVIQLTYRDRARKLLASGVKLIDQLNWRLADRIVLHTKSMVEFEGLQRFRKKISSDGTLFIDTQRFSIQKSYSERQNLVGYVGRLSAEKGVENFAKAVPLVHQVRSAVNFLVVGDGALLSIMKGTLKTRGVLDKVRFTGDISRDEVPAFLNELKLIVLPSYTEGLPTVALEAMACGTPVLATPVGGIPDLIKDGETGFIMENNNPECIAENVIRALNHPDIDKIAKNARELVEKEFTYEATVERYREILKELS